MADGSGTAVAVSLGGERGKVGTGTASSRLKNLHRLNGGSASLKEFVKSLGSKNPDVAEWQSNKGPTQKNRDKAARKKLKGARIAAEALATKQARSKGKK